MQPETASMPQFESTSEGYREAKRWMKDNGHYHLLQQEQSVDGFTLVELANKIYEQEHPVDGS